MGEQLAGTKFSSCQPELGMTYVYDLLHDYVSLIPLERHAAGQQFVSQHSYAPNIYGSIISLPL